MNDLDYIRQRVTPRMVAEELGFDVNYSNKMLAVDRDEGIPSVHLYDTSFYDYGSGEGGDVFRFFQYLTGRSFAEAKLWLEAMADGESIKVDITRQSREEEEPVDLSSWLDGCAVFPLDERSQQWEDFLIGKYPSLSFDFIDDLLETGTIWRLEDGIAIPHYSDGDIVTGIKIRTFAGSKTAVPGSRFQTPYRVWEQEAGWSPTLYIVEGESDAWCVYHQLQKEERDHLVISLPSGASSVTKPVVAFIEWYAMAGGNPVVILDNDKAGLDGRKKLDEKLGPILMHRFVPGLYNDIAEWLGAQKVDDFNGALVCEP